MTAERAGGVILAIDSATTRVVVAAGTTGGELLDAAEWPAGYRHGETLLPAIDDLLSRLEVGRAGLSAVVVGTGPGAFTGLRVGIATAKGLAQAIGCPIIGISTAAALLAGRAIGCRAAAPGRALGPPGRDERRPGAAAAGRYRAGCRARDDARRRRPARTRARRRARPGRDRACEASARRSSLSARRGWPPATWTTWPGSSRST